jgi:hypothetical protein
MRVYAYNVACAEMGRRLNRSASSNNKIGVLPPSSLSRRCTPAVYRLATIRPCALPRRSQLRRFGQPVVMPFGNEVAGHREKTASGVQPGPRPAVRLDGEFASAYPADGLLRRSYQRPRGSHTTGRNG